MRQKRGQRSMPFLMDWILVCGSAWGRDLEKGMGDLTDSDNRLLPVYAVVGDDLLKRDRVLKRLHMRLEELGDLSFNSDTFDGAEADGEDILNACSTAPFASELRLVVVNNASKLKKKAVDLLTAYIKDPVETTVLVLVSDTMPAKSPIVSAARSLDKRSVIDCASPKARDLPAQVRRMASSYGLDLTDAGAKRLVALIGQNTMHLDEELKKLALIFVEDGKSASIGPRQIDDMVAHINKYKPWDFVDALAVRDINTCVHMLCHMPSASPIFLLSQCVTRLRDLVAVKSAVDEGGDVRRNIIDRLGLPPKREFLVSKRIDQASRFRMSELIDGIASSMETERRMKTGSDQNIAFQEWAFTVMGGNEKRHRRISAAD